MFVNQLCVVILYDRVDSLCFHALALTEKVKPSRKNTTNSDKQHNQQLKWENKKVVLLIYSCNGQLSTLRIIMKIDYCIK